MKWQDIDIDRFTDRTDVNAEISLFDQGCIRNSETNKTLFPQVSYDGLYIVPSEDDDFDINDIRINIDYITFEDVKEELKTVDEGYFSFIGSDRQTELALLDNNYLSNHIQSLNMYNGCFLSL